MPMPGESRRQAIARARAWFEQNNGMNHVFTDQGLQTVPGGQALPNGAQVMGGHLRNQMPGAHSAATEAWRQRQAGIWGQPPELQSGGGGGISPGGGFNSPGPYLPQSGGTGGVTLPPPQAGGSGTPGAPSAPGGGYPSIPPQGPAPPGGLPPGVPGGVTLPPPQPGAGGQGGPQVGGEPFNPNPGYGPIGGGPMTQGPMSNPGLLAAFGFTQGPNGEMMPLMLNQGRNPFQHQRDQSINGFQTMGQPLGMPQMGFNPEQGGYTWFNNQPQPGQMPGPPPPRYNSGYGGQGGNYGLPPGMGNLLQP